MLPMAGCSIHVPTTMSNTPSPVKSITWGDDIIRLVPVAVQFIVNSNGSGVWGLEQMWASLQSLPGGQGGCSGMSTSGTKRVCSEGLSGVVAKQPHSKIAVRRTVAFRCRMVYWKSRRLLSLAATMVGSTAESEIDNGAIVT